MILFLAELPEKNATNGNNTTDRWELWVLEVAKEEQEAKKILKERPKSKRKIMEVAGNIFSRFS